MHPKTSVPPTLQSHEEAVMYFISQMDLEMLNALLDKKTYQDFPKWEFIMKLQRAFDEFAEAGETHLFIFPGRCNSCDCPNKGKSGYLFYSEKTKDYFNLIFELDDNRHVTDLYECSNFKESVKTDFEIGSRKWIDNFDGNPF